MINDNFGLMARWMLVMAMLVFVCHVIWTFYHFFVRFFFQFSIKFRSMICCLAVVVVHLFFPSFFLLLLPFRSIFVVKHTPKGKKLRNNFNNQTGKNQLFTVFVRFFYLDSEQKKRQQQRRRNWESKCIACINLHSLIH